MTKTQYLKQGVDILRADLLTIFQDPDGELAEMGKAGLKEFAKDNWDHIEEVLASREDTAPEPEVQTEADSVEDDSPLDQDPESSEDESPVTTRSVDDGLPVPEEWEGNPKTNMHTGAPGRQSMRTGNRNLG